MTYDQLLRWHIEHAETSTDLYVREFHIQAAEYLKNMRAYLDTYTNSMASGREIDFIREIDDQWQVERDIGQR